MFLRILVVSAVLVVPVPAFAGIVSYFGHEESLWEHCSLVYGTITSMNDVRPDFGMSAKLTIDVHAVLMGGFDPMEHPTLTVPIHFMGLYDPVFKWPAVNSNVLVVLERRSGGEYGICGASPCIYAARVSAGGRQGVR